MGHKIAMACVVGVVLLPALVRPSTKRSRLWEFVLLLVIMTLFSPLVWYHHSLFLIVPLIILFLHPSRSYAVLSVMLVFVIQSQRLFEYTFSDSVWPVAAAGFVLLGERGGSSQVCHMHGELLAMSCTACESSMRAGGEFDGSSTCPACGASGQLRPDVVWFGEIPYHMDAIEMRLADCDLFVAIGTSGLVYPAAGFVRHALAAGATTVEINSQLSEVTDLFHHQRTGLATAAVSALVDELLQQ